MLEIHVHGLRIAIHEWRAESGDRTGVLCMPSTGLSGRQWRRLAELLSAEGHRVLAPDLIGYGGSDAWTRSEPFEIELDIDVTDVVLDRFAGPVHLVGHSYGGRVGLGAGLRRPHRLRSIALFEPTCFGVLHSTGDDEGVAELASIDADGRFFDEAFGATPAWLERFVDYWGGPGAWASLPEPAQASWLRSHRKVFQEVRRNALDRLPHTAYVEALGHLPLLTMSGATSTVAGRHVAEILAREWPHPGARHVEFPGVGHMAPVRAGEPVAREIRDFIRTVESGAAPGVTSRGPVT